MWFTIWLAPGWRWIALAYAMLHLGIQLLVCFKAKKTASRLIPTVVSVLIPVVMFVAVEVCLANGATGYIGAVQIVAVNILPPAVIGLSTAWLIYAAVRYRRKK